MIYLNSLKILKKLKQFHITIVPAFGILLEMLLWGSIKLSLINTSSLICTSSATTLTPSILTHYPTMLYQPMMLFLIKAWLFITDLLRIHDSERRTPLPMTQSWPMATFGPMTLFASTFADGWISTFPIMLSPLAKRSLPVSFKYCRYYFTPTR